MKDMTSHRWTMHRHQKVPPPIPSHICLPTTKSSNQKIPIESDDKIKKYINTHWYDKLRTDTATKPMLKYLCVDTCCPGQIHPIWSSWQTTFDVIMVASKTTMFAQRYGLSSSHCAGNFKANECLLWHGPSESTAHFFLTIPAISPIIPKYKSILEKFHY